MESLIAQDWETILWTIFWSSTFIGETKIGIPYALYNGLSIQSTYIIACFSNLLAFPITMGFLDFVHGRFEKYPAYNRYFNTLLQRTRKKTIGLVRKYGYLGILIFVMFPVPMTGAYVGSVACWLFDMNRKKSFIAVAIGAFISGAILVLLYEGGLIAFETMNE
jgi:uncharacterized membrane protein